MVSKFGTQVVAVNTPIEKLVQVTVTNHEQEQFTKTIIFSSTKTGTKILKFSGKKALALDGMTIAHLNTLARRSSIIQMTNFFIGCIRLKYFLQA